MEPGFTFGIGALAAPIVFVAPWGMCSDWWDIPAIELFRARLALCLF